MPNIRTTKLVGALICALALFIGPAVGQMALPEQGASTQSPSNFRDDFPFKEICGKTFKDETVQLDGNAFIDCTFDNVILRFEGDAPFRFTNDHFTGKFSLASDNPVVKTTMELIGRFIKMENASQNPTESK